MPLATSSSRVLLEGGVDQIHLVIVPEDEFPGQFLHEAAAGQDLDVLGNLRVVSAGYGQAKEPGDGEGRQPDGAGRCRVNVVEALAVAVFQHFQNRWVEDFLLFIFRQIVGADGFEMRYALLRLTVLIIAGDQRIAAIAHGSLLDLLLKGQGDAVDLIEGVGKVGDMRVVFDRLLGCRGVFVESLGDLGPQVPAHGELGKGHEVGGQQGVKPAGRSDRMEDVEYIGTGKMIEQMVAEVDHDPVGEPVDEREPLLFARLDGIAVAAGGRQEIRMLTDQLLGLMAQQRCQGIGKGMLDPFAAPGAQEKIDLGQHARLRRRFGGERTVQKTDQRVLAGILAEIELAPEELPGNAVKIVGHGLGGRRRAMHRDAAGLHGRQGSNLHRSADEFGVCPGDIQCAVIVGAAEEPLLVRVGIERDDVVFLGQTLDILAGQLVENGLQGQVFTAVAGAVELEVLEEQQQPFEMLDGQPVVYRIQRMGDDVENRFLMKIGGQFVDVVTDFLDFPVLGLGDIQGQNMQLAAVFREIAGDLLADKSTRQVGDFEGAVDTVVIADGHMRHPPSSGDVVDLQRFGKTLGAADFFEDPLRRSFGVLGMDMKIDLHRISFLWGVPFSGTGQTSHRQPYVHGRIKKGLRNG